MEISSGYRLKQFPPMMQTELVEAILMTQVFTQLKMMEVWDPPLQRQQLVKATIMAFHWTARICLLIT